MAPRRRKALSPASQRRALVPEWDATKGRSAFDADAWSSDGGATPTPPPTPRKAVIGESADFHKAIAITGDDDFLGGVGGGGAWGDEDSD